MFGGLEEFDWEDQGQRGEENPPTTLLVGPIWITTKKQCSAGLLLLTVTCVYSHDPPYDVLLESRIGTRQAGFPWPEHDPSVSSPSPCTLFEPYLCQKHFQTGYLIDGRECS